MDKYCSNSVGLYDFYFMLLDDYLYVVDIVLWLLGGKVFMDGGMLLINDVGEMLFVEYYFLVGFLQIIICMYCCVGSQCEIVQVVIDGVFIDIMDMCEWCEECGQGVVNKLISGWQSIFE